MNKGILSNVAAEFVTNNFVFERFKVQVAARRPAVVTVFVVFFDTFRQVMVGTVPLF
jgi:hypothetical protein